MEELEEVRFDLHELAGQEQSNKEEREQVERRLSELREQASDLKATLRKDEAGEAHTGKYYNNILPVIRCRWKSISLKRGSEAERTDFMSLRGIESLGGGAGKSACGTDDHAQANVSSIFSEIRDSCVYA